MASQTECSLADDSVVNWIAKIFTVKMFFLFYLADVKQATGNNELSCERILAFAGRFLFVVPFFL